MQKYQCSSQEVFGFMVSSPISLCLSGCPQAAHALGNAAAPPPRLSWASPLLLCSMYILLPWHSSVLGLGAGGYSTDTSLFEQMRPLVLAA